MNNTYGVTSGKSLYAVSDQPLDFIRFGMSIEELQPFEETEADAAAIYGALQVPFELAPKPKGSTFSNLGEAKKSFYQNVIIPKAANLMQSISNKLGLTEARLYLHASFDKVDELQENLKEKSEIVRNNTESFTKQYERNLITKNQWLVAMGYEAVPDGDIYINDQQNDVPLAVKLGVGGTQALQSILADYNLSEEAKKNTIVILFGISEQDAAAMVVSANANRSQNDSNGNTNGGQEQPAN
jgi:hypothetical protein